MGRSEIILQKPKYIQNLGAAVRASSCFGVSRLIWTGSRINPEEEERIPRELRMKAYSDVEVVRTERPFDLTTRLTPVCIELVANAEPLSSFVHPENAVYVFGPEDGDVSQVFRRLCHRFVYIPSKHCLNLAATINVVLYDRQCKLGVKSCL